MAVYEIEDLTKIYPQQTAPANDHISLEIESGEIFGLLGDNGAGKSTLIKQMANLLKPSSGQIRLFGKPLTESPLYTPSRIGYMPQSGNSLNNLTVGESIYFTAHLRGLSRHQALVERDQLLERWELGPVRDRVIVRLSGGQRRLALLAITVAASPPVLILDEPTNDLDPQHRQLVWDSLRTINQEKKTTIILVTHNVIEAEKVIERVGIMRAGRLIALGRPGVLKAKLNQQLRLEVVFQPNNPPPLPNGTTPRLVAPGRWQLFIEREHAPAYIETLNHAACVEDFRLSTASLEDLYLSLANEQH